MPATSTISRTRRRRSTRTSPPRITKDTLTKRSRTWTVHTNGTGGTHSHVCSVPGCTVRRTDQEVRTPATYQCASCTKHFCTTHIDTHGCSETGSTSTLSSEISLSY